MNGFKDNPARREGSAQIHSVDIIQILCPTISQISLWEEPSNGESN
jgi:hypothetical protein